MSVQTMIRGTDDQDRLPIHRGPFASDCVVRFEHPVAHGRKRRYVLRRFFVSADDRKPADSNKLMQRTPAAEKCILSNLAMPAQQNAVGGDDVVAKHTIMSNMDRAHQKNAVSQPRRIFSPAKWTDAPSPSRGS